MQDSLTVILDPYLLLDLTRLLPVGSLTISPLVRLVIVDYFAPAEFRPEALQLINAALEREGLERIQFSPISISDLLHLRSFLVLHQIISIAVAREHSYALATSCAVFRRKASAALGSEAVFDKDELCARLQAA